MKRYYINNFYISKIPFKDRIAILLAFLDVEDTMLFFHSHDHFIHHCPSPLKEFIEQRIRYVNNAWIFPWGNPPLDEYTTLIWYEAHSTDEITKATGITTFFTCIINRKNAKFEDYSYVISLRESVDSYVLIIDETNEGDLSKRVLPKITKYLSSEVRFTTLEEILSGKS